MNTIDSYIKEPVTFGGKISFDVQGGSEKEKERRWDEIITMVKLANSRYLCRPPLPLPCFLDAIDFSFTVVNSSEAIRFLIILHQNRVIDQRTMELFTIRVKNFHGKPLQTKF